jgi:hypothetical protein
MKHTINDTEVDIDWSQYFLEENHGSGCTEWAINGEDENGNKYTAIGSYQDDELIEVTDIELT